MKYRGVLAAALTAALLGVAGCGSSGGQSGGGQPDALTVWLMVDAQKGWSKAVKEANTAFKKQHPGVKVQVRYQNWDQYLTKFEAALGAQKPPDVIEIGNTQTMKYMASGALLDLSENRGDFENSKTWLNGLTQSCTFGGKLFCVPYYAGSRAVIYRKDMLSDAGVADPPSNLKEFGDVAAKLMNANGDDSNFSAFYFPGKYWYAAMSFVYDYGGQIATKENGKWQGALDSPQARTALTKLKQIAAKYSRASKTADEAQQDQAFADGGVAMLYGNAWEIGVITGDDVGNTKLKGKLGAFALPSHKPGQTMPSFLGGSDLAVPVSSDAPDLATDWIADYTSTDVETTLVKAGGVLPNTTSLLDLYQDDPINSAFAAAAQNTWFVPTAKNWTTVEQKNVIPNMLVNIFTEKKTVPQATSSASDKITNILNEG